MLCRESPPWREALGAAEASRVFTDGRSTGFLAMPTRFLLIAAPRTGSTAVRMAFAQMPGVFCHGEVLAVKQPIGFFKMPDGGEHLRNADAIKFYEATAIQPYRITGIKILHFQLFFEGNAALTQYLIEREDVPVIHLWRRDLCGRFLSGVNFRAAKRPPPAPLVLTKDEMVQDFRNRLAHRKWARQMFRNHDSVAITFEELTQKGDVIWPRIQALLHEPVVTIALPDKQSGKKESFVNYVANADELRAFYETIRAEFEQQEA
jgi:hypothetical protein